MATPRELASSLQLALKKTFDDSTVSLSQIMYWIAIFVNKYNSLKLQQGDSGLYLSVFPNVPVQTPLVSTTNLIAGRKYVQLPTNILDLKDDGAINYISYNDFNGACQPSFAGVRFWHTTPIKAERLYYNPYEKPRPDHPYYYRVKNYVYLLGVECISLNSVEMGLYTTFDPFTSCTIDETMELDDSLVADVYKNVLELGRFVMLVPENNTNTGTDNTATAEPVKQRVTQVQPTEQTPNQ